ncbi:hypothetical protein M9H77_04075 [Catharanthus roseus]|uniref:Uncharacterized protein n=1 Tax=Catharanthus roseus TaxID=4058 RepID=A0ACC0CDA4_CATRO|nr:hypothetical protein M9H77_04075 [Catharanthus roseus]
MPELGSDDLVLGSGLCPWSPTVALHVLFNLSVEAALMCLDALTLSSCARNLHISSGWLGAQQAIEVLGQEFLDQISPERQMVVFYCGTYNLVPRGTQIPYSAAIDLVAWYHTDGLNMPKACKNENPIKLLDDILKELRPRALKSLSLTHQIIRASSSLS